MATLEAAISRAQDEDLRDTPDVGEALSVLTARHPKGDHLAAAWRRGLAMQNSGLRVAELDRMAGLIRAGLGKRWPQ